MAVLPLPDREKLLECFDADLERGILTWRVRPRKHFASGNFQNAWNARYAGHEAGYCRTVRKATGDKRWVVGINGIYYHRYRIIFFLKNGTEPPQIDHRDGNSLNDRCGNLRSATQSANLGNRRIRTVKKTGLPKGVRYGGKRWAAQITVRHIQYHLGMFDSPEAAHEAYVEAAKLHFGEFWCAG